MRAGLPERALWAEDAIEAARLLEEADRDAPGARSGHRYQAARAHQLYVVAQATFGMGDPDGALQFLEESAEIFRLLGDQRGRGRSVGLYGAVRQRKSEYGPAEENFRAALALLDDATSALAAREAGTEADPEEERQIARDRAMILGNLGTLLKNKGRADDAERAIGEAIDTFRKIGDTGQAAIALDNLGALRSELRGDRKGALRAFGMAKRIFRGLGWRHDEAVALLAIGRERANAGEHAAAERTAQELLALSEELGDLSLRGWALALLGSARLGLKDPASAAEIYGEVLGLSRQTQDGRLGIMAKMGLGRAALPDNPAEALDHFEEGLVAARGIPVPLMVGQLLFDKAQALDALGRREEAIAAAEEAVASREELEAPEVSGVREWLAERRGSGHLR
jgi:tetratricopeptide (TPR) repeat protein